jgi:hypothetical protein
MYGAAVAWRESVYTGRQRWCALGLWQEILRLVSRRAVGRVRFIDGPHIKCHPFAANPAGGQHQAIGRTKNGLNTTIAALATSSIRYGPRILQMNRRNAFEGNFTKQGALNRPQYIEIGRVDVQVSLGPRHIAKEIGRAEGTKVKPDFLCRGKAAT